MPLITYQGPIITVDTRSNANNTEHPVIGQPVVSSTAATRVLAEIELGSAPRPADPVDTGNANNTEPQVNPPSDAHGPRCKTLNFCMTCMTTVFIFSTGFSVRGLIGRALDNTSRPAASPPPSPLPPTPEKVITDEYYCNNICQWSIDNVCDDGSPGSEYSVCIRGTDCNDCGLSDAPPSPSPPPPEALPPSTPPLTP